MTTQLSDSDVRMKKKMQGYIALLVVIFSAVIVAGNEFEDRNRGKVTATQHAAYFAGTWISSKNGTAAICDYNRVGSKKPFVLTVHEPTCPANVLVNDDNQLLSKELVMPISSTTPQAERSREIPAGDLAYFIGDKKPRLDAEKDPKCKYRLINSSETFELDLRQCPQSVFVDKDRKQIGN
jgi:hypothetical protein